MILVLLGTQNNKFDRLLKKIEDLITKKVIKDKVIVQAGYTKYISENMEIFDFISNEELNKLQDDANLIITHGGVGSIISSIKKCKKVIAIPRLHEFGEHVNDHQKDIVNLFSEKGYIIGIEEIDDLENAILESEKFSPLEYKRNNEKMLNIISDFIDNI